MTLRTLQVFVLGMALTGCGGAVSVETPSENTPDERPANSMGEPDRPTAVPAAGASASGSVVAPAHSTAPVLACTRRMEPPNPSCDATRGALNVRVAAIVWEDSASAWSRGSHARLELELDNASPDGLNYPGAIGTSSDPRVLVESAWADLYALFPCDRMNVTHGLTIAETLPPGTRIDLELRGTLVDEDDAFRCRPATPATVFTVVVP
mgnify:CR=1 FL=1